MEELQVWMAGGDLLITTHEEEQSWARKWNQVIEREEVL